MKVELINPIYICMA